MISHISGKIIWIDSKSAIVEAGGIGYEIRATAETLESLKNEDNPVSLWTHHVVREDSETLYGFKEREDMDFFELLMTVSGIGPKTALGILNVASVPHIKKAVRSEDASHLVKVSGVGKKMAEKIVLELKNKVGEDTEDIGSLKDELEAIEALKALGYSPHEAREALKEVDRSKTTSERIREALKNLGR